MSKRYCVQVKGTFIFFFDMHNYISSFDTPTCSYHIYHDNIILLSGKELSDIIFPGLFHELRTRSTLKDFFSETQSSSSRYKLPSDIDPDTLLNHIRNVISSSFLFIHTWMEENSCEDLLKKTFDNYEEFFETAFSIINEIEKNSDIRDIAVGLHSSIKYLYKYFGPYYGNLEGSIYKTSNIKMVMLIYIYMAYICNH